MATTLTTNPPEVAFSENRLSLSFQTDSFFESLGVLSINEIRLTGAIVAGRAIAFTWGLQSVTFQTDTNQANGTNLPTGNATWSLAQSWATYLQANFYIDRDFNLSVPNDGGTPRVVLVAKTENNKYNFAEYIYTGVTATNTTAGTGAVRKKNLALILECQVQRHNSSTYDTVYNERIPYRSSSVEINIAALLHSELQPDFPAQWDTATPWKLTRSLRNYRLLYSEGAGEVFSIGPLTVDTPKRVLMGGTGYKQGLAQTPYQWARGASAPADRFLRYGPPERYLQTDEPQWLTFLNTRSNITTLSLQIRIEYADGSIVTVSRAISGTLATNEAITIPIWLTALNLQSENTLKAIRSYYVRVKSGTNNVSEEVRYIMDYANRPYKRYFVYVNSLGVLDSLMTYGKGTRAVEFQNIQVERPIPINYTKLDADMSDLNAEMRDTFTVASGYCTAEQLRLLRDFRLSPYKFIWESDGVFPIVLKAQNFLEKSDGQNQHYTQFEYQYAFQQQKYD